MNTIKMCSAILRILSRNFLTLRLFKKRCLPGYFAGLLLAQCIPAFITKADAANLLQNPSVETANTLGTLPLNWNTSKSGTNTSSFSYKTSEGHTGTRSVSINMTQRTSGWAMWLPVAVAVKPNTQYTYKEFYKANVTTEIDIEFTSTTNAKTYKFLSSPPASAAAWSQVAVTFTTPANVKQVVVYHLIYSVGSFQTDDFFLEETSAPNGPAVSLTAPAAGAQVSGTQAINATASDAAGIAGVQFQVDGANLGAEDTTSPYSASWNTTALQNCSSHTISAIARNTASITATDTHTVTVQNGPALAITAPAAGATVTGTVPFTVNATGACGLLGVQFQVDGTNIGAEDTAAPFSVDLNSGSLANGSHTLSAIGRTAAGSTTATQTIQVSNSSSGPTVSITSPAGATVSGTQAISANATDASGIAGVQFKIDGANLAAEDTVSPYSVSWNTATLQNCSSHSISAVARNTSNLTATAVKSVMVRNGPTVTITAPAAGATVSGTIPFTAAASGVCVLAGVQFQVDGVNIGSEITASPYSVSLNTATLASGSHTLTVIGRQSDGSTTTAAETIQINTGNLLLNPSFEIPNGAQPANWAFGSFGTNSSTSTYLTTGHSGSRSARMEITSYTNGAVIWAPTERPVTAGHYLYTQWSQSNVDTEVDADITFSDGTTNSYYLGAVLASPTAWSQAKFELDVPANATSITVYPVLYSKGWAIIDDLSFAPYSVPPLNRGLVSITFDDGYSNHYTEALPRLSNLGLKATFYIISGSLTDQPTYMTAAQVKDLVATKGMEVGSHSITHSAMPSLTQADLINEMSQSQATLAATIGATVNNFAYPYGDYNGNTLSVGSQYYQSQRNSDYGYNSKGLINMSRLKIQAVNNGTTPAQVKAWVDQAQRDKIWLILLYHQIQFTQPLPAGDLYTTLPANLQDELQYIKDSGIGVVTVNEAIQEIQPQLQ